MVYALPRARQREVISCAYARDPAISEAFALQQAWNEVRNLEDFDVDPSASLDSTNNTLLYSVALAESSYADLLQVVRSLLTEKSLLKQKVRRS